jgi:hypothetical protein
MKRKSTFNLTTYPELAVRGTATATSTLVLQALQRFGGVIGQATDDHPHREVQD